MTSISGKQKRGPGRPATGIAPQIGVRLSHEQLSDLDLYCAHASCSRSDVVREALDRWREAYTDVLKDLRGEG